MDLAQYGITFPVTFFLLVLGAIVGKLWQLTVSHTLFPKASFLKQISLSCGIIFVFIISLVTTYLVVGIVLTSYLYGVLTSGIIGEWSAELILAMFLVLLRNLRNPMQPLNARTNLHTLPEVLNE